MFGARSLNNFMKIKTSLQGLEVCAKLKHDLSSIKYNHDLQKLLNNIYSMISEISKLEVNSRRMHNYSVLESPLKELNETITKLEQYILLAKLMN
jgi:hypothetical protein